MGNRNRQLTGRNMNNMERDQQGFSGLCPEPCISANFPQPNIHTLVPAPGSTCSYNFHHVPEHGNHALFYGMTPYASVQGHPAASNPDFAVAVPSGPYTLYMANPRGIQDFPLPMNHGTHGTVGIPIDRYGRNMSYMDGVRSSFKGKNDEGIPGSYQHRDGAAGPSSSVGPTTIGPIESDVAAVGGVSFPTIEQRDNGLTSTAESGSQTNARNMPGMTRPESALEHYGSHATQDNYNHQPVHFHGNTWSNMHVSSNGGNLSTFGWTSPHLLPYPNANVHGVEAGNISMQGYQVTASNRNSTGLLHPPIPQSHPNFHHLPPPMQGFRGYNVNIPSQVAASSRRVSIIRPSDTRISPFQDVVDAGRALVVPTSGFRLYQPHQREVILNSNARHRNSLQLRVLPEDEVAMLEIPGYHEADQLRDMRLDIDHMSYEELLALEEQIGSVGTGFSEESVQVNLKTRTFSVSETCSNPEEAASTNQKINFCVICQSDYEDQESIGSLDCGHEFHGECIKEWLLVKNTCPICKSTALRGSITE